MEFRLQNFIRPHLKNMPVYESNRPAELGTERIYLDANESPFGDFNRYPDAKHELLKKEIAAINQVAEDQVFLGNGSDELIDLLIRTFCEPAKDRILMLDPSFSMYEIYARFNNVQVGKIALDDEFQIDQNAYLQSVSQSQAKILFLCSPNNPTGNSLNDLKFYIQHFPGIVVVDEAYIEFSPNVSAVTFLKEFPNMIVLKTLSKAYAMAGLRVGAGFASVEIVRLINRLKPPYNISAESQRIALDELKKTAAFRQQLHSILAQKSFVEKQLAQLPIVEKVYPSDANFLLVKFYDAEKVYEKLSEHHIKTSLRHPKIKNCIRISIGSETENKKLLSILSTLKS